MPRPAAAAAALAAALAEASPRLVHVVVRPDGSLPPAASLLRRDAARRGWRAVRADTGAWQQAASLQSASLAVAPSDPSAPPAALPPSRGLQASQGLAAVSLSITGSALSAPETSPSTAATTEPPVGQPAGAAESTTSGAGPPVSTPGPSVNVTGLAVSTIGPDASTAGLNASTLGPSASVVGLPVSTTGTAASVATTLASTSPAPEGASTTRAAGTPTACANATAGGECASAVDQSIWGRRKEELKTGALLSLVSSLAAVALLTEERRKKVTGKPVLWVARMLGMYIMGDLLLVSLPWVGFLLAGCMWNAVNGLTAVCSLFAACVPDLCQLLDRPTPCPATAAHVSAMLLASSGVWGLVTALSFGEGTCARRFFWLSGLLCLDSLLFAYAVWLGEGGGAMGLLRGRGFN